MTSSAQTPTQSISVTSELMQNYRLGRPIVPGGRVATAFNPGTGLTEVFTAGTNGHLMNLFADRSSDTGWSLVDLGVTASVFDACDRSDGSIIVYALDPATGSIRSNIKKAGLWQGWGSVGKPVVDPRVAPYWKWGPIVLDLKVHRFTWVGNTGTVYETFLSALCNIGNVQGGVINVAAAYYPSSNRPGWGWSWGPLSMTDDWCPGFVVGQQWMPFWNGVFTAGHATGGESVSMVRLDSMTGGVFSVTNPSGDYTNLTSTPGWHELNLAPDHHPSYGCDDLFALWTPGPTTNGGTSLAYHMAFDTTSWVFAPRKLGDTPVTAIAARTMNPGPQSRIEVFALGAENKDLYHCRQTDADRDLWTPLLRLDQDLQFHQLVKGCDPGLYSEVFGVTTDSRLIHVWQGDADDTWHYDEVDLGDAATGAIEPLSTYSLQLTVYDPQQVPVGEQQVTIFSDAPALLDVNGVTCLVRPGLPWQCKSLPNGEVSIVAEVETLGAPRLSAWTTGMPAADRVTLEASAPLRDRLADVGSLGGDALLAAKVTDDKGVQTNLLTTTDQTDAAPDLAKVIQQSMAMAAKLAPPPTAPANLAFFHRTNDHRVARYVAADPAGRLPAPDSPAPFGPIWQVDFSSSHPVYSELTQEQASAKLAELQALPGVEETGLGSDWGSVWDLITGGVAALGGWLVDGLNVTLHMVIDGVRYVYNAVVAFVEQAFALLEEVFARVKVLFQDLFRWLAHIFGWDDIRRTQAAIVYTWQQGVLFTESMVRKLSQIAASGSGPLGRAKATIDEKFEGWVKQALPQQGTLTSTEGVATAPPADETKARQCMAVNVFQTGLMHGGGASGATAVLASEPFQLATERLAVANDFLTQLTAQTEAASSSAAFTQAKNYFTSIAEHPDELLERLLSAILEALKGLALLAVEAAQQLVVSFCNAVLALLDDLWSLLNQDPGLPFVSDLYSFVTTDEEHPEGEKLTLLNLVALIIATPATMLHKLFVGGGSFPDNNPSGAPFPTPDSLTAFKAAFSATTLERLAGLSTAGVEGTADDPATTADIDREALQRAFKSILAATAGLNIVTDVSLDLDAVGQGFLSGYPRLRVAVMSLGLAQSWFSWIFLIPWADGQAIPPGTSGPGLGRLVWTLKGILPLLDTLGFLQSSGSRITRSVPEVGPMAHGLYGCACLVGVVAVGASGGYADNDLGVWEDLVSGIAAGLKILITVPTIYPVLAVGDVICDICGYGLSLLELKRVGGLFPVEIWGAQAAPLALDVLSEGARARGPVHRWEGPVGDLPDGSTVSDAATPLLQPDSPQQDLAVPDAPYEPGPQGVMSGLVGADSVGTTDPSI